jgi:2,3-diaminopropionate biosynthesis protein SbnA
MQKLSPLIGNSPLVKLDEANIDLSVKIEYTNLTGSIKDRAAYNMIFEGISQDLIGADTVIIESSSGNFAIALATICRELGLRFVAVIDPNINAMNEQRLRQLAWRVVKVDQRDVTGGFLLTRINYVKEFISSHDNAYWPNQYENPNNYLSYYYTLAPEIAREMPVLDYVFAAVSSGGTITGLSMRLKELYKNIKIVAVDVEGSVIFGSEPKKREISGIGSSKRPPILNNARIDEVMIISEDNIRRGAKNLYATHGIYGGASCGAAYYAVWSYFYKRKLFSIPKVLFICPDHGRSYVDSVYERPLETASMH